MAWSLAARWRGVANSYSGVVPFIVARDRSFDAVFDERGAGLSPLGVTLGRWHQEPSVCDHHFTHNRRCTQTKPPSESVARAR